MNQMNMHSMPPGAVVGGPGGMAPGMVSQGMGPMGPGMAPQMGPGMPGGGIGGPGMPGPGMGGPGMPGQGMGGSGMTVGGSMMQQQSPQMQQVMQQQVPQPEKIDNISKVKSFIGPLRETLTATLKSAAQVLHQNHTIDAGSQSKPMDAVLRFDKNLEEFYSVCDQIELHLRTSISCIQQAQSAAHYLPLSVLPARMDPPPSTQEGNALSYPQYLSTVRGQIAYAKEIHDTLVAAAQKISATE